jgi:hypothetical protein
MDLDGQCGLRHPPSMHTPWVDLEMSRAREHKGHVIGWVNEVMWAWAGAPWVHNGDMCGTKGAHTSLALRQIDGDLGCVWERMGRLGHVPKEWTHLPLATWACWRGWMTPSTHPQRVSSVSSKKHTRQGCTKEVGARRHEEHTQGWGTPVPRDTKVDECMGSWACQSMKGHVSSFGRWSTKGHTHPKDTTVHEGDIWSPYKNTRAHNQGRKEQEGIERKSSD